MTKTERLQLRITPELKAKLQEIADAENRTLTNCVENLIIKAIENQNTNPSEVPHDD